MTLPRKIQERIQKDAFDENWQKGSDEARIEKLIVEKRYKPIEDIFSGKKQRKNIKQNPKNRGGKPMINSWRPSPKPRPKGK